MAEVMATIAGVAILVALVSFLLSMFCLIVAPGAAAIFVYIELAAGAVLAVSALAEFILRRFQ